MTAAIPPTMAPPNGVRPVKSNNRAFSPGAPTLMTLNKLDKKLVVVEIR